MPAGCDAVMVQVPVAPNEAVEPETEHAAAGVPVAVYMIGMVELLDVADSVSGVPTFCAAIVPKVMTCCTGGGFT